MNIADSLRESARRLPDSTALLTPARHGHPGHPGHRGEVIAYRELDRRADGAAALLRARGLRPGDRLALVLGNVPELVEVLFGALRAGLVVVPVNVESSARELAHMLSDSEARAAVVATSARPTLEAAGGVLDVVLTVEPGGGPGTGDPEHGWRAAVDAASADLLPAAAGQPSSDAGVPADLALLAYTSGSTGVPKGAQISHANLHANQDQLGRTRLHLDPSDVVLCSVPLFHLYALGVGLLQPLVRGAAVLLLEHFDPQAALEQIAAQRVSVVVAAPPVYVAWSGLPPQQRAALGTVRAGVSGAAALPAAVCERFRDELGIPVWEGYGLTETSPVLTTTAMGADPVPGSVGRPLPGVRVRLVDDDGDAVGRGELGEVVVRGPNVFIGYWRRREDTAEVLDPAGWLRTGDVGYVDRGNLFLVDRKRDLIVVSGFNVYPREVEEVLLGHPAVAEAAVVGVPHPSAGEAVKAVVVPRPGAEVDIEQLRAHCRAELARFKCPSVIEVADRLPHLPGGKVRRADLRAAR